MECEPTAQLPEGGWQYELKLDGYRTIAIRQRGDVELFLAQWKILQRAFPEHR